MPIARPLLKYGRLKSNKVNFFRCRIVNHDDGGVSLVVNLLLSGCPLQIAVSRYNEV